MTTGMDFDLMKPCPGDEWERRCPVEIQGRAGTKDGLLRCVYVARHHSLTHRFLAPDASVAWWPVEAGDPPSWEEAIHTPATDPRWPT